MISHGQLLFIQQPETWQGCLYHNDDNDDNVDTFSMWIDDAISYINSNTMSGDNDW